MTLRRREFISLLGGAVTWPISGRAQSGQVRTIGFLGASTASAELAWVTAASWN